MTNEEKALELAIKEYPTCIVEDSNGKEYDWNTDYRDSYKDGATAMAEWKDQQFKEYLEKKAQEINPNIWEKGNLNRALSACRKGTMIEIINEFFNENRL